MNSATKNQNRQWARSGRARSLLAALLLVAQTALAQPVLQAVDIANLPGGQVQLRFQMSGPVDEPRSFTVNDPARLVLDFDGVRSGLSASQQAINQGPVQQVTVLEGSDRTRAAINLSRVVPYTVRRQGNNILLTLDAGTAVATPTRPAARAPATTPVTGAPPQLGAVEFRRGARGEALIDIRLGGPNITVDVRQQGNDIIADFFGAQLPRGQERRLDVTDFATPVTLIDAFNQAGGARIVIQRSIPAEFLAYQTDDRYTIEVAPAIQDFETQERERDGERVYTGELLSLNFQDIEVRAVLQILADFTGLNVVVSDTVQGNLTLRLQNVPWDQALDIILQTKGLTQRQNGNVIYIAPAEEVAAREQLELQAVQTRQQLEPLRTETIQINYAKAEDLAALIKEGSGGQDERSLLSSRGTVSADPRSNILLIQDIPGKIAEVRNLITILDIPVRQVQIDARIVIASDTFRRDLGVRWGIAGFRRSGDYGLASIAGTANANEGIINQAIANLQGTGQPFPITAPALADRLGVNLGVDGGSSIAFAILGQDYLLDLELSALQAEGRGETLSNPRVITTDRKEAKIVQGQTVETIIRGADTDGAFTTEAFLELAVTPQITPDGRVIMDLKVTKNDIASLTETRVETNNREVETQVLVDNGETVVLGGVFESISANDVDKVPFLGDLPAIGRLFKRTINLNNKFELLIFVTPQIVNPGQPQ